MPPFPAYLKRSMLGHGSSSLVNFWKTLQHGNFLHLAWHAGRGQHDMFRPCFAAHS